jgi:predicted amidohydrolase
MRALRVGVAQLRSGPDPWENLLLVDAFVQEAAEHGCQLLCFPENVFYRGPKEAKGFDRASIFLGIDAANRIKAESEFSQALAEFAADWPVAVSLGSVLERSSDPLRPYNSHWMLNRGVVERYRKIHLFSFQGQGVSYDEAADVKAGELPLCATLDQWRLGLSICFDLRFPELYRKLVLDQGAEALLVPAAFTRETGRAHWELLLRARAVENLSYVIAAAQWGEHLDAKDQRRECYGRSMIVDPWGEILAEAPEEGDALLLADLDGERLRWARERLPALTMTRLL